MEQAGWDVDPSSLAGEPSRSMSSTATWLSVCASTVPTSTSGVSSWMSICFSIARTSAVDRSSANGAAVAGIDTVWIVASSLTSTKPSPFRLMIWQTNHSHGKIRQLLSLRTNHLWFQVPRILSSQTNVP